MIFKGPNLHPGQVRIMRGILNTTCRYSVINCSRQFGKSFLAQQLALYLSINFSNTTLIFCQPTHAQAKRTYEEIYNGIAASGVIKSANISDRTIILNNKSRIIFTGVEKADNLRGLSAEFMIMDEFAFYKESVWTEVLRPMLMVRGKKAIFVSTPKGKNNLFYKVALLGMQEEPTLQETNCKNYNYFKGDYKENPFYNLDEIEDAKKTLPTHIFKQEYLGEFIDSGQELFPNVKEVATIDSYVEIKGGEHWAGLDLGRQDDWTVLTILNKQNEVVFVYRDRQKNWSVLVDNIIKVLQKYNARCLVETNSIGDVIFDLLKNKLPGKILSFYTTASSKQPLIENLLVEFQNKNIKIPTIDLYKELHDEMETFTYEYNPRTKSVRYTHQPGFHDDTIDSLALAIECKKLKKGDLAYSII